MIFVHIAKNLFNANADSSAFHIPWLFFSLLSIFINIIAKKKVISRIISAKLFNKMKENIVLASNGCFIEEQSKPSNVFWGA